MSFSIAACAQECVKTITDDPRIKRVTLAGLLVSLYIGFAVSWAVAFAFASAVAAA